MSDDSEISKLMSGLLDGGLTPSELARALRLAAENEAAGKRLVDLLALRSALPAIIAEAADTEKPECLRVRGLFLDYREGRAEPAEVGLLSRHLDDCLPCALAYDVVQAEADGTLEPLTDEDDDADDDDFDDAEFDDDVASAERPESRRRPVRKLATAALCVAAIVAVVAFALMRREPAAPATAPAPPTVAPAATESAMPTDSAPTDSRGVRRRALVESFEVRPHLPVAADAEALKRAVAELQEGATAAHAAELDGAATPERLLAVLAAHFDGGHPAAERVRWALAAANADPQFRLRVYDGASGVGDAAVASAERAAARELVAGETAAAAAAAKALRSVAANPSEALCAAFAATLRRADACPPEDVARLLLTLGRHCRSDPRVVEALAEVAENAADDVVGATAVYVEAEARFDDGDLPGAERVLDLSLRFLDRERKRPDAALVAKAALCTFGDPEWIQRRAFGTGDRAPEQDLMELWPTVDPSMRPERL